MRTELFDFEFPDELIALRPVAPRDAARLLVVDDAGLSDCHVHQLPDLLRTGDVVVLNDTRVIPAALKGERMRQDARARISVNLHKRIDASHWRAFAKPARKLDVGDRIRFGHGQTTCMADALEATVSARMNGGEVALAFDRAGADLDAAVAKVGAMPLPPYIASKRAPDRQDIAAYQTVFAARDGAVAAPTASLHFTDQLFEALTARGIAQIVLTLHVGAGTFLPVKAQQIEDHTMHAEWGEITPAAAEAINAARAAGGRLIAVGTTVVRLLESAVDDTGVVNPFCGDTNIFISPGYRFRAVDGLMTNFHLPRSTLFMLVAAFAGLGRMQAAYRHAIAERYRFYSYGDSSLLWPARDNV